MGTTFHVKIVPAEDGKGMGTSDFAAAFEEARKELDRVDGLMSTYKAESELSRFNASDSTGPFPLSPELCELFEKALAVSAASGGAFDVTVGPLVNAWGFGSAAKAPEPPSEKMLDELRTRVGPDKLILDPANSTIRKTRPDVYCDLGAIAKGYAVDKASEALERAGIVNYMVEVGGEVRTAGTNAAGAPWRIAVEKPDFDGRSIQRVVPFSGLSMATSGDYRNYYEVDGKRVSHTINPRTGRPISHKLASVTVMDRECAMADAYATALMVLGPEQGMALAEKEGLAALFLVREREGFAEQTTKAFAEYADAHVPEESE